MIFLAGKKAIGLMEAVHKHIRPETSLKGVQSYISRITISGNRVVWSKTWAMYSLLLTHLQLGKDREEIFDSDGKFVRGKEDVEEKEDTRFTHLPTFGDGERQPTQTYDGDRISGTVG